MIWVIVYLSCMVVMPFFLMCCVVIKSEEELTFDLRGIGRLFIATILWPFGLMGITLLLLEDYDFSKLNIKKRIKTYFENRRLEELRDHEEYIDRIGGNGV